MNEFERKKENGKADYRLGVLFWNENDELDRRLVSILKRLGYEVVSFLHNEALPSDVDLVLVHGPFGSLVPFANQILNLPSSDRPSFVLLMTEQLPKPTLPEWYRYGVGIIRSRLERFAYYQDHSDKWQIRPWLRWATKKGIRFRYYGDLYWFRNTKILSAFVISSHWTADFLRKRGFNPTVSPISFKPDQWTNLQLERNIPVLWLGKIGSTRRQQILNQVRADLKERGVEILFIDGVEHPYVFGEERTMLLSRTKIVLNILREKWDDNSMRYSLAIPRGALVVTEPTLPHTTLIPGKHLVEAPVDKLADTICYYLEHDEERKKIADQAYEEISQHSGIDNLHKLIKQVLHERVVKSTIS